MRWLISNGTRCGCKPIPRALRRDPADGHGHNRGRFVHVGLYDSPQSDLDDQPTAGEPERSQKLCLGSLECPPWQRMPLLTAGSRWTLTSGTRRRFRQECHPGVESPTEGSLCGLGGRSGCRRGAGHPGRRLVSIGWMTKRRGDRQAIGRRRCWLVSGWRPMCSSDCAHPGRAGWLVRAEETLRKLSEG